MSPLRTVARWEPKWCQSRDWSQRKGEGMAVEMAKKKGHRTRPQIQWLLRTQMHLSGENFSFSLGQN